jgi:PDZ domain-containing protein
MVTPTDPHAHGADPISATTGDDAQATTADDGEATIGDAADATTDPDTEVAADADGEVTPAGNGSVPAPPAPPTAVPLSRRRRIGRVIAPIGAFMLVAFLFGAALVPLPYYQFKPGSVRDTEPLIEIEGVEVFPSDGAIGYTTVSLRQATLFGLLQGWLDDDIDIIDSDVVLQGRNENENREINLQAMSDSKQTATQVALERLGYDVDVTFGQFVSEVDAGLPADGLISRGELIVAVDGERFEESDDLTRLLAEHEPGDTVTITVQTVEGTERDVDVTLAAAPGDPDRGILGVRVTAVPLAYDFPFDVTIDTGDVGGPSAGLAFTLALIDDLTPGDLTGGHDIAVTGTILPDGTVGPVGGTGQKAAAVREEGITLFLVPSRDYDEAVARAGDDLQVVPVDTIDDALAALGERGGNVDDLPEPGEAAAAPVG